jgi:hypothetical protein
MKHWISVCAVLLAAGTMPALANEATFERTLQVSGAVTLHVSTGSGYIHIKPGPDSKVHIFGRVKSNGWDGREDRVKEIAATPPIEQTGSILRVGGHMDNMHNISIDYEIEAPAKTLLDAGSGSGDVEDEGVGVEARLNTGSGTIHATGLQNGFTVGTGSGDIYVEGSGSGDVVAHTGSGSIELKNVSGGLKAQSGSGDIKINGQAKADWKVTTGSGTVELWPDRAGFTLDASTGSGEIKTDREMLVQGSIESHHHITGKINGGGPMVRVETGSGDIRVH